MFKHSAKRKILLYRQETRLSSIESQPKKVVVVVGIVFAVFVVVIIVDHKNLTLKFGQNWVNNKGYKLGQRQSQAPSAFWFLDQNLISKICNLICSMTFCPQNIEIQNIWVKKIWVQKILVQKLLSKKI